MAVEKTLPKGQFDNVVRWIKRSEVDRLDQLAVAFNAAAIRLNAKSRKRYAVAGTPEGSDHFESGSIVEWLNRVQSGDTDAIAQVVALHSTLQQRLNG